LNYCELCELRKNTLRCSTNVTGQKGKGKPMPNLLKRFYLWGIDGCLRYRPVIRILREHARPEDTVLEVGSGPHGLTLYWPRPVVGYDVDFGGPDLGWLRRVKAEPGQRRLPFGDGEFDFVVSADMLEHLPADERPGLIRELVRVSRGWTVLCCPCGPVAEEFDRKLVDLCRQRGVNHPWAAEHLERGLPEVSQVEHAFRSCLDQQTPATLAVHGNLNTDTWYRLWRFTITRSGPGRSVLNKLCWPLVPWLSRKNREPTYRKVFTVHKLGPENRVVRDPAPRVSAVR